MKIKENTYFWDELSQYQILVPDYQRDYAQGRRDGGRIDNIRETFIAELLDACRADSSKVCHLGLVFGSYDEVKNMFVAVDGQQRLTTVFLLYWYLLWRNCHGLGESLVPVLSKFKWNTRSYSSQFARLLMALPYKDGNVIDVIKSNKDYFSVWEKDPSVAGMLVTIGELGRQYQGNENIELLLSDGCRIRYDILPLESTSDGKTYLKMNSRGRSLTTYENIKAQLQDRLIAFYENGDSNEEYMALVSSFDREWSKFMLERTMESCDTFKDPDVAFMYYINEYAIGSQLTKGNVQFANNLIAAKIKAGDNMNDVPYCRFDHYLDVFSTKDESDSFKRKLDWIVNNYQIIQEVDANKRYGYGFFLKSILGDSPEYSDRVLFFSMLKFAELSDYKCLKDNRRDFSRWMRVFHNLVSNTDIGNRNLMDIILEVDKIDRSEIYSYLYEKDLGRFNREQVLEEKEKVFQIIELELDGTYSDRMYSADVSWEKKIEETEHLLFFDGAVRFLFRDADGIASGESWQKFDEKLKRSLTYFDENGVKDTVETKYRTECVLLKAVLNHVGPDGWWNQIEPQKYVLDNTVDVWRNNILLQRDWSNAVDKILTGNLSIEIRSDDNTIYRDLYSTTLLEYLANKKEGSRIRWIHGHRAIYQPYHDGMIPDDKNQNPQFFRNRILATHYGGRMSESGQSENKIYTDVKIETCNFFYGWDVRFKYRNRKFIWEADSNEIVLLDDAGAYSTPRNSVNISMITDKNLLEQLDALLNRAG